MSEERVIDYRYPDAGAAHTHNYLWAPVCRLLEVTAAKKVFDLGCGNGAFARKLQSQGHDVQGVDPSEEGVAQARKAAPDQQIEVGSAYDPLSEIYGTYPAVVSLEVVEHVYYPRKYAKCVADLLCEGGVAIVSTPYHGYWKNVALAISGKMDSHFTALWDHGHIKFWSVATLTELFAEQGLICERVLRVGRFPILGKSMILMFRKG